MKKFAEEHSQRIDTAYTIDVPTTLLFTLFELLLTNPPKSAIPTPCSYYPTNNNYYEHYFSYKRQL